MKNASRSTVFSVIALGALTLTRLVGAPGTPGDLHTFEDQILAWITKARPAWSEEQRQRLAGVIVSDLKAKLGSRLTDELRANILKCFDGTVSIFDGSADEPTVRMTVEYYRWAIAELVVRKPITGEQLKQREEQIRKCFAEAVVAIKPLFPADLHQQVDRSAESNLERTLNSLHDPLFPGLKLNLSPDHVTVAIKTSQASCQDILGVFDRAGGLSKLKKRDGSYQDVVPGAAEVAFRELRHDLEYFQVTFGPELLKATNTYQEERRKERETVREDRTRARADAEKEFRQLILEEELKHTAIP